MWTKLAATLALALVATFSDLAFAQNANSEVTVKRPPQKSVTEITNRRSARQRRHRRARRARARAHAASGAHTRPDSH